MSTSMDEYVQPDFKPSCAAPEILPGGYEKDEFGVHQVRTSMRDGELREDRVTLCHNPITIIGKQENPDTNEVFYIVEFPVDGVNKQVILSGSDLSQKKGMHLLANYGLLVEEDTAKALSGYLMKTIALNHIEKTLAYSSYGWKNNGFVLGDSLYTEEGKTCATLQKHTEQTRAITCLGDLAGWVRVSEKLLKYPNARFRGYCSVAAPILRMIHASNISINDSGATSRGKTTLNQLAMSIWGDPEKLVFSGGATANFMEGAATLFNDLPVNLDDAQTIKPEVVEQIIYKLANGIGKGRMKKDASLRELNTWHTIGLFSSESTLLQDTTMEGAGMRLIELYGGLGATDAGAVNTFKTGIKDNYGGFGVLVIEYLVRNREEVIRIHHDSLQVMDNKRKEYSEDKEARGTANRLADIFASILTAGEIFESLYVQIGGERQDPEKVVFEVFKEQIESAENNGYALRGLNFIRNWVTANRSFFLEDDCRVIDSYGNRKQYKILGNIGLEYYYLITSEVDAALQKEGFDAKRLMNDFKTSGLIISDRGRKDRVIRIEGKLVRAYCFKSSVFEGETGGF